MLHFLPFSWFTLLFMKIFCSGFPRKDKEGEVLLIFDDVTIYCGSRVWLPAPASAPEQWREMWSLFSPVPSEVKTPGNMTSFLLKYKNNYSVLKIAQLCSGILALPVKRCHYTAVLRVAPPWWKLVICSTYGKFLGSVQFLQRTSRPFKKILSLKFFNIFFLV